MGWRGRAAIRDASPDMKALDDKLPLYVEAAKCVANYLLRAQEG
jgi:hypothetical protein